MLCDPRIVTRPYGKAMIASLPPMTLTRDPEEAAAFLRGRGSEPRGI
jgi:ATP-dependent DNA helicase DinG